MIPSPLAAITYTAVKVAGYAAFAWRLNKEVQTPVSPFRFAAGKTALSLAGGFVYVFAIAPALGLNASDLSAMRGERSRLTARTAASSP